MVPLTVRVNCANLRHHIVTAAGGNGGTELQRGTRAVECKVARVFIPEGFQLLARG